MPVAHYCNIAWLYWNTQPDCVLAINFQSIWNVDSHRAVIRSHKFYITWTNVGITRKGLINVSKTFSSTVCRTRAVTFSPKYLCTPATWFRTFREWAPATPNAIYYMYNKNEHFKIFLRSYNQMGLMMFGIHMVPSIGKNCLFSKRLQLSIKVFLYSLHEPFNLHPTKCDHLWP